MSGTAVLHVFCNQESKCVEENCWGSNCKVTEKEHFYNALMLDKFKQWDQNVLRHLFFANFIFKFIIRDY